MAGGACLQENTIASFVAGHLVGDDLRLVVEHLDRCPDCHAVVAGARSTSIGQAPTEQTPAPIAEPRSPGDVIADKYEVERVLGQGGMGVVLCARHIELGQRVAIKILRTAAHSGPEASARFLQEARALAVLESEHLVRVFDVGRLPAGTPYMVMEYLDGTDLAALLRERERLPTPEAVDYLRQACVGLSVAHRAGMVHRDLKPANLFLATRADGKRSVKILDFGIAKSLLGGPKLTAERMLLGSPRYMAPEQLSSPRDVDARADVWGLGAIAYRMLVGRPPLDEPDLDALLRALMSRARPPLEPLARVAPAELAQIIGRCLEPAPEQRLGSVDELGRQLAPFGPSPSSAPPPEIAATVNDDFALHASEPPPPRSRSMILLILGAALLLVIGGIVLVVTGGFGALLAWRMEVQARTAPLPSGVDPRKVDAKDVMQPATALATALAPSAELVSIDVDEPVHNGQVDLTRGQSILFLYEFGHSAAGGGGKKGALTVEVTSSGLSATSAPFPKFGGKLPQPSCGIAGAWKSAVAAGVHPSSGATFHYGDEIGVATWVVEVPDRPELRREVDGATCAIVSAPP